MLDHRVSLLKVGQVVLVLLISSLLSQLIVSPNAAMMGVVLAGAVLAAILLWYKKLSLPVMLATFFGAGMGIPFRNSAEIARWVILALAAAAGLMLWVMSKKRFRCYRPRWQRVNWTSPNCLTRC